MNTPHTPSTPKTHLTPKDVLLLIDSAAQARFNGIARYAREHAWRLMIENRRHVPRGWRGDGVLVTLRDDPKLLRYVRALQKAGIPVVDLTCVRPDVKLPRVTGDNEEIGRLAARHFLDRNFRSAAWFSSRASHVHDLRFGAFARAWTYAPPARWVWSEAAPPARQDNYLAFSRWLAALLQAAPKPLAVFAYSDYDAVRVLNVCRSAKLAVPGDVAILGVDDNPLFCENQAVTLSSVEHDLEAVGFRGAALLGRLMAGRKAPAAPILVPPRGIITRRSTDIIATADPALRRAIDYIAAHLGESFGSGEIARTLEIPRVRLDRLFAAEFGRSVGKEIRRQRMARARVLLTETDESLKDIAAATGFCHVAHFANAFSKKFGVAPGTWRREQAVSREAPPSGR